MASIKFQTLIEDASFIDEELEGAAAKENAGDALRVVEIHSGWSGPCKSIVMTFQRLYLDMSDRPLKFYTVNSEKVDHSMLKPYLGKCEPVFKFFKQGACLNTISGVNTPELEKTIREQTPAAPED